MHLKYDALDLLNKMNQFKKLLKLYQSAWKYQIGLSSLIVYYILQRQQGMCFAKQFMFNHVKQELFNL